MNTYNKSRILKVHCITLHKKRTNLRQSKNLTLVVIKTYRKNIIHDQKSKEINIINKLMPGFTKARNICQINF